MKKLTLISITILIAAFQISCKKESILTNSPLPPNSGTGPIANAGPDQYVSPPASSVLLSGTGTSQNGTITAIQWTKINGPEALIETPQKAITVISNLMEGEYEFLLTVTDDKGKKGTDVVRIMYSTNSNIPPKANAGNDTTLNLPIADFWLNGSGTDIDGSLVGYKWRAISGPGYVEIVNSDKASTLVRALRSGVYHFELTVTDNLGATGKDSIKITADWDGPCFLPITDWLSFDTSANSTSVYNDGHWLFATKSLCPPGNIYQQGSYVKFTFSKNMVGGSIVYTKLSNNTEVSIQHPSQPNPFIFNFASDIMNYADGDTFFYFESTNPYSNSGNGQIAFRQAASMLLGYQYRCFTVQSSVYNSHNINWNNYLEVVSALNISP